MEQKVKCQWASVYWLGTMLQMAIACLIFATLKLNHLQYSKVISLLLLALGGTSSAVWGIIVSKKSKHVSSYRQIVIDYFNMKQPIKSYALTIIFLFIIFGYQIFTGKMRNGIMWYSFFAFFAQSIVFGGIEEIGWRYTFQPILKKKMPFEIVTVITFVSWGLWHYMYFYLTGSITYIQHDTFLIGLLGNCFALGIIYEMSNSLWLCVLYHCLLNMFSQTMLPNNLNIVIFCNVICIFMAILLTKIPKAKAFGIFRNNKIE